MSTTITTPIDNTKSEFETRLKSLGEWDNSTHSFVSGEIIDFKKQCENTKPDVDQILTDLLIPVEKTDASGSVVPFPDPEKRKIKRIEETIESFPILNSSAPSFSTLTTPDAKKDWVKAHLSMSEKMSVLAEVQAIESLTGDSRNPYPSDIEKAKKSKATDKKLCIKKADELKSKYQAFISDLRAEIQKCTVEIATTQQQMVDLAQGKKGVSADNSEKMIEKLEVIQSNTQAKKNELIALLNDAIARSKAFEDTIETSLSANNLSANKLLDSEESEKKDKSADKSSSAPSIKSPYSSLSGRSRQTADSQEAKDLYQSFAAANTRNKFLMLTGLDAHNMLQIARNLSNVNDRTDLQKYCTELLNGTSKLINSEEDAVTHKKYIEKFDITITVNGKAETLNFESLDLKDLTNGLDSQKCQQIRNLFVTLHSINLGQLHQADLYKLQNYANALLVSTTLQEAKWGLGKQITKGLFKFSGKKKNANFDLANDVSSFMRPISSRKDEFFKEISTSVDKGHDDQDFVKYGRSTAVQHGQRTYDVRSFDER